MTKETNGWALQVVSRQFAIKKGRKQYRTGKPCPKGHTGPRLVSTRQCIQCVREADTRYKDNPKRERMRVRVRQWRKFGALAQPTRPCPERCELCGRPPTKRALHLDHDHETGLFRGWLCHHCNTNLGKFGDCESGLILALEYLRRARAFGTKTPEERKNAPIASGVLAYFPQALLAVAEASRVGNEQHNPGQSMRWTRSKSTDDADALIRHLIEHGTLDADGVRHTAKVAWRALALLQREIEKENAAQ